MNDVRSVGAGEIMKFIEKLQTIFDALILVSKIGHRLESKQNHGLWLPVPAWDFSIIYMQNKLMVDGL